MPVETHASRPAAADWWANYVADSGLTEDRYIKAVEAKPGPGAARASCTTHVDEPRCDRRRQQPSGGTLVEYAVGKNGDIFPDGAGQADEGGREGPLQHALPLGRRGDHGSLAASGFVFYPKGYVPKHVINTVLVAERTTTSTSRPAPDNVRSDALLQDGAPARLVGFMPHMHNRGKRQCLEAIYPNMARRAAQLRELRLQLADRLQLRRRGGAAAAGGHDHARHQLARQLGRQQATTRTRATGSASATAPPTTWRATG